MKRKASAALVAAAALAVTSVASSAPAPAPSSDEVALAPIRTSPSDRIEKRVDNLLRRMTTEEKLQQVQLLADNQVKRRGRPQDGVGGVFSATDPTRIDELQHIAVEKSRLGIPILFAYDTIHGYRTIFPVPLATAGAFDPEVASDRRQHRLA